MKKSRFNEVQIVEILKEGELGVPPTEISRKYGISIGTFYNWRARYGGLEVSELARLKALEAENHKLKHMYAELSLDHKLLKDIVEKKLVGQPKKGK
jgi:putative transposase